MAYSILEIIFGKLQGIVANLLQTLNTDLPTEPRQLRPHHLSPGRHDRYVWVLSSSLPHCSHLPELC